MISGFKRLRLKRGLSRSIYKHDFNNIRCLHRRHWYKNTRKDYYSKLLVPVSKVNKI